MGFLIRRHSGPTFRRKQSSICLMEEQNDKHMQKKFPRFEQELLIF